MNKFDYSAPAELFPSRNRKIASKIKYRRFDKRPTPFASRSRNCPSRCCSAPIIQIDEQRLGHKDIRALYESERYPLRKGTPTERIDETAPNSLLSPLATRFSVLPCCAARFWALNKSPPKLGCFDRTGDERLCASNLSNV